MTSEEILPVEKLKDFTIRIYEPFAEFLGATDAETSFTLSLLDAYRFAGHACPSMTGAFLVARAAVEALFPETKACERGLLEVHFPGGPTDGAAGPFANVLGFITGAWGDTGFGGLEGKFARRGLLQFRSALAPKGGYRFFRRDTGQAVEVFYDSHASDNAYSSPSLSFPLTWRHKVNFILDHAGDVIRVRKV